MKYLLWLAVVLLASGAQARDVSVSVYSRGQTSGFLLLTPGHSLEVEESRTAAEEFVEPGRPSLEAEFIGLAPVAAEASSLDPSQADLPRQLTLFVPDWMRGGENVFARYRSAATSTFIAAECHNPVYRPYPGLASSAQARRRLYYRDVVAAACDAGVPVDLFDSLIVQESRYDPAARSRAGAIGMAQLMPGTARDLGVFDTWDVRQNLTGGARYLRAQLDEFGEWHLALGAYNAGPGAVRRHGGVPPYRETQAYVRTILSKVRTYVAGLMAEPQQLPVRRATLTSWPGS